MTMIIAGAPAGVHTLAEGRETDANIELWAPEPVDAADTAGLAAALVAFEAEVAGRQVESIVLADDSDAALAAASWPINRPLGLGASRAAATA